MKNENSFDSRQVLGEKITELGRRELCELVSALCDSVQEEVGAAGYRGGVFPENILVDDGGVSLGPAAGEGWQGQELSFLAPEVFWHGEGGPAADVYSLGLLLYYAIDSGRLPFAKDGEELAHKRRMNGESFAPPKASGRRLGEIIAKATRFQASERYRTVAELKAALDSFAANPYLAGAPSAESVFHKSDEELSKVERMMVAILARDAKDAQEAPAKPEEEHKKEEPAEESMEDRKEDIITEAPAAPEAAAEVPAAEEPAAETPASEEAPQAEKPPVVELREEKNPELEPVVLSRAAEDAPKKPFVPRDEPFFEPEIQYDEEIVAPVTVKFDKNVERERKLAAQVKRRRLRPVVFAAVLCALLVAVAVITRFANEREARVLDPLPLPTPMAPTETPSTVPDPVEGEIVQLPPETAEPAPVEHAYALYTEDVSWTEARARCIEKGGHLVVISSEEEFRKIVGLAESYGASNVWVGCHRVNGVLVWENDEVVEYYPWGTGEPSLRDGYDGADEDYLLLWLQNGAWVYNDSRDDPVGDYPGVYSGRIAYICEFDDGVIHQG